MDFEAKGSTETHCGLPVSLSGPALTLASAGPARGGAGRGSRAGRQAEQAQTPPAAAPQSASSFLLGPVWPLLAGDGAGWYLTHLHMCTRAVVWARRGLGLFWGVH